MSPVQSDLSDKLSLNSQPPKRLTQGASKRKAKLPTFIAKEDFEYRIIQNEWTLQVKYAMNKQISSVGIIKRKTPTTFFTEPQGFHLAARIN